ncbi:DUF6124 family protein [Pseudomonas sp. RHF3.3-3]|uniref:DUF6124 family protein n=1 Tax=Pseudomonas sp. RHF3.3-3 TaxID=3396624 RepID=UPI003A8C537D
MFKVTPNPPNKIDPEAADRALTHYLSPKHNHVERPGSDTSEAVNQNREDLLVTIHSIMDSAAATAYENADNLTGPHRKVAMGVVHLIELAQRMLNVLIEKEPPTAEA